MAEAVPVEGTGPTRLAAALAAWVALPTPASRAEVYASLVDGVLLLAVRARAVGEPVTPLSGLPVEREAELSVLTVDLGDGRRVLPTFSSAEAMRHWQIEARPVEAAVRDACRAVLDEDWTGLVVDPGRHDFVIGRAAVTALADGFVPVAADQALAVAEPIGAAVPRAAGVTPAGVTPVGQAAPADVLAALRRAVAREPAVAAAWLLRGRPVLEVGLELRAAMNPAGLATVASRLADRLGALLADEELRVVALDRAGATAADRDRVRLWP